MSAWVMLLTRELRTTAIRYAQFVLEKLGEAIVSTLLLVLRQTYL